MGRYRVVAELARGSTSVVHLGIVAGPGGFNKLFALKQLRATLAEDPANVAMFLAEAKLAGRLSHPNVVSTLEIEEEGALPYIVMEYLDGQPLFRAVARARMTGASIPLPMQLAIVSGAVEGLSYAHQAVGFDGAPLCVVHCDVSPHNVFVTYAGQAKLLDFGIAQSSDGEGARTGSLRGKVAYMSPEQAAGMTVDARADLFSAGVMLWEAVTGQRFWSQATSEGEILGLLASGRSPTTRERALAGAPPDLQYVILNATEPDPADRYESAAALQADLQVVLRRMAPAGFSIRDVGQRLGEIFSDDRARLQTAIDAQLESVQNGGEDARSIPRLSAHSSMPPTGSSDRPPSSEADDSDATPLSPAPAPAHAPRRSNAPPRIHSPPPSSGIAPLRAAGHGVPRAWLDEAAMAMEADAAPAGDAPRSDPARFASAEQADAALQATRRGSANRSLGTVATLPSVPVQVVSSRSPHTSDQPPVAGTAVSISPSTTATGAPEGHGPGRRPPIVLAAALAGIVAAVAVSSLRDRWSVKTTAAQVAVARPAGALSTPAPPAAEAPSPAPVAEVAPPAVDRAVTVDRPEDRSERSQAGALGSAPVVFGQAARTPARPNESRPPRATFSPNAKPAQAPRPAPLPAQSARSAPPVVPITATGTRPLRPIDATNPYAP